MRIIFITSKLNFVDSGGSIEEFDLMIKTLIGLGNQIKVITAFSHGNKIPADLPYKVIEEKIPTSSLLKIQYGIFKLLRKYSNDADIFHIDGHLFLYGAGFYRFAGGKIPIEAFFNREIGCMPDNISTYFYKDHKNSLLKIARKKIRLFIEKYIGMPIANKIDIASIISPQFKAEYQKLGFKKNNDLLVIGDPFDYKSLMKENQISESSYTQRNKSSGVINILYSSRMAPNKGFDVLLMGFNELENKENFRLILGGSGPEEKNVKDFIQKNRLDPYVELTGWVSKEKLFNLHKQADIFIQADWRPEGTSISLLYAMAFGIPSILPGGGGLAWVAKNSALYFRPKDYKDLAKKIEQLGNDPQLRTELSRNCYLRLAEDEMNFERQIGRVYQEMKRVVGHD
jgi:glycosyltransferase involved in cell wall biosynthesis